MSTVSHWSANRKRSRFTAPGGVAASPLPMGMLRHRLQSLRDSVQTQLTADEDSATGAGRLDTSPDGPPIDDDNKSSLLSRLMGIQAAQQRIADGSYGLCVGCGRPIRVARLQAVPEASHCLACETDLMEDRAEVRSLGWAAPRQPHRQPEPPSREPQNSCEMS